MPHQETFVNGVWYPSVTTVMGAEPKPWLDAWRDKWGILAERKTKIADAIGTEFHRCVESWLNTGTYAVGSPTIDGVSMPTTVARVQGMMRSWVTWAMSVEGTIEHTELQVRSETHTYSGTLDAVGLMGKKPMVFDWKTSSRIYPEMQTQLSAYAEAYNEERAPAKPVKHGLIVHVSKEKPRFRCTTKEFTLGKRAFGKFLKLRAMFDSIQAGKASE